MPPTTPPAARTVLVALLDPRGWILLQERDEHAPVDPDKWSLVGGGVEPGETPAQAAHRELLEETGVVREDLSPLGTHTLPCAVHGEDTYELFTARTLLSDDDVECHEGRRIVFVDPAEAAGLDLTDATRSLYLGVPGIGHPGHPGEPGAPGAATGPLPR